MVLQTAIREELNERGITRGNSMNTPGTTERRDVLSALQLYRGAVNALALASCCP